jgi:hypothetical protein
MRALERAGWLNKQVIKNIEGPQSRSLTWKGRTTAAWRDSSATPLAESAWPLQARWPDRALLFWSIVCLCGSHCPTISLAARTPKIPDQSQRQRGARSWRQLCFLAAGIDMHTDAEGSWASGRGPQNPQARNFSPGGFLLVAFGVGLIIKRL